LQEPINTAEASASAVLLRLRCNESGSSMDRVSSLDY
jgi:hypothetical protein